MRYRAAAPASTCETRERWVSVIGWQQGFVLVGVRTGTEGRPGQTNTHRAACEMGKAARLGDYKHCACRSQKKCRLPRLCHSVRAGKCWD